MLVGCVTTTKRGRNKGCRVWNEASLPPQANLLYLYGGQDEKLHVSRAYYITDKLGQPLCAGDGMISVADAEGKEQCHPWTLSLYLKVSGVKYPSRAGFFCVKKAIR